MAFYEVRCNDLHLWNFLWLFTKHKKALLAIHVLSKGAPEVNGIKGIWILGRKKPLHDDEHSPCSSLVSYTPVPEKGMHLIHFGKPVILQGLLPAGAFKVGCLDIYEWHPQIPLPFVVLLPIPLSSRSLFL